ncbi:hypothetical protein LEP1GSC038_4822 [Leptospira weilii str. 2006001855]|uniref:Uncharacterized protein n=1 Tax=Leptospira weilii str. 2006001855 TaxID=996804 RepID=M6FJX9_9LEPT|nr:hypothetical protein LEP1GSC038_4822 [Leptospira weilii str. 2006001855]
MSPSQINSEKLETEFGCFLEAPLKSPKTNDKPNKHNRRIGNRKKSRSDLSLPADCCSYSYALGQIL